MVNLFVLFCSLIIQFGAAGLTPFNMLPLNTANESYIDTVKSQITGSKSRYWSSYSNYTNIPNDYWVVIKGYNNSGSAIVCLAPNEYVDSSKTTSITSDAFNTDENGVVSNAKLKFNQYTAFPVATNSTWIDSNANIHGWKTYDFLGGNWSLLYCNIPIYYNGALIISITDDVTVPEFPSFGGPLGSLGAGGHSSGGSPIDELNSNGVTWSSTHGNFTSTGHSIQNVTTPPAADPNSNLELILSGFLGGILNNTNDILGNTSQIGAVLGGISNNIIQGTSAIFNAISNINNTISGFINYIMEPLDQEEISDKLEEVSLYQTINSLVGFSDSFLSAINSVQDPEHLYLTMDFRNANEPFRRLGLYVFDFTFLDNLKSTWQPILLAVLYVTLGVNIFYDLPNIVHGISGLSGGDE